MSKNASKPSAPSAQPLLKWNGIKCEELLTWLQAATSLIVAKHGYAGQFTQSEGNRWVPRPRPTKPLFEPLAEALPQLEGAPTLQAPIMFNYYPDPSDRSLPGVIDADEKDEIMAEYKMALAAVIKLDINDQGEKPKIVETILSTLSPAAKTHLEQQVGYNECAIIVKDPCALWRLIIQTFSHVDTGRLIEDVLHWLEQIITMRMKPGETLAKYRDRAQPEIDAFNGYIKRHNVKGIQEITPEFAAGIYNRGIADTFKEARKDLLNSVTSNSGIKYPQSIEEAFLYYSRCSVF